MAAAGRDASAARTEYWPSFVDVLTNLLLVFVFLLSIFALVQFLLTREVSSRDEVLNRLNAQIAELTELLALERAGQSEATDNLSNLAGEPDAPPNRNATGCAVCSTASRTRRSMPATASRS